MHAASAPPGSVVERPASRARGSGGEGRKRERAAAALPPAAARAACCLALTKAPQNPPKPNPHPHPHPQQTTKQSKKRGLSLEDKRDRVLEVFHTSGDVFVLKDVEKLAAAKGVVLQSVKEVLQSLVDDDLVRQEKIGISNYFWSFPAEASTRVKADEQRARREAEAREQEAEAAAAALAAAKAALKKKKKSGGGGGGGGDDQEEEDEADEAKEDQQRQAAASRISELERLIAEVRAELSARASSDPKHLGALREAARLCADSCGRWADNLGALRDWLAGKFEGRGAELDGFLRELGYDEDKMGAPVEP
jgi:Fe2+ or Zn2+ uptake regulation protein